MTMFFIYADNMRFLGCRAHLEVADDQVFPKPTDLEIASLAEALYREEVESADLGDAAVCLIESERAKLDPPVAWSRIGIVNLMLLKQPSGQILLEIDIVEKKTRLAAAQERAEEKAALSHFGREKRKLKR